MANESHTEGELVWPKFCTQRKEGKCSPCGNDYTVVIKDLGDPTATFTFPRQVVKKTGPETQFTSENAHHILCVAEVTKVISKDEDLKRVLLKGTEWCINAKKNMVGLPLFYHTVHWYCTDRGESSGASGDLRRGVAQTIGGITSWLEAPKFKNLCNHDFDHNKYNTEVETELNKLKAQIKTADHDFTPGDLVSALNGLSDHFRNELVNVRGMRRGGTHEAWMAALHGEDALWYEPFSMASGGGVTKRAFPGKVRDFGDKVAEVLQSLQTAIANA